MAKTITIYTPAELKEQYPAAYEKVLKAWAEAVGDSGDIPWSGETIDSLKQVIEACGFELRDWRIGPYSPSYVKVSGDDDYYPDNYGDDDEPRAKDADWYLTNVLAPLGYVNDGKAHFPGLCKLTGYGADDDLLESVYKSLLSGRTLTEALEDLADDVRRMFEADLEQQQDEESMLANWGDSLFTEHGEMI